MKQMSKKVNWHGTYDWFHPACAAARETQKHEAKTAQQQEAKAAAVAPAPAQSPEPDAVEFDFPAEVVFRAAAEGIPTLSGFEVESANPIARPRRLGVATKASLRSWGEKVTVLVTEVTPTSASMSIESAAKTVLGASTRSSATKNSANIKQIIRATSDQLDRNGAEWANELGEAPPDARDPESQSIEERLRRLDALREEGLINEEDFEARKQAILSEL
jgi:hypothetical protein